MHYLVCMYWGPYTNYVDTKGGRGGSRKCLHLSTWGEGGFVESIRSFLDPIFSKKLYICKGGLHDIFI